MVYNDWRDLTQQNAYAPLIGKEKIIENIFKDFTYSTNRPFTIDSALCKKQIDNSAFIMYWLDDVLIYFDFEYVTPTSLHQNLTTLDRNVFEGVINTNYNFWTGDVVFLSTDSNFTNPDSEKYYIGIWWTSKKFISFDVDGFHTKSLAELLTDYPIFTNMSVFRI